MPSEVNNERAVGIALPPEDREEVSSKNTATKIVSNSSRSINDSLPKTEPGQEECNVASSLFVRSSEIHPSDVLCRQGHYDNPGNVRFRALVKTRQDAYVKAKRAGKTKLAQEIIDAIEPGRFLQIAEEGKGGNKQKQALWKKLDDDAILDKVKMALRQKPKNRKTKTGKSSQKIPSTEATNCQNAPVETKSSPRVISAEQHASLDSQHDSIDIFSPLDIETIDTEIDFELGTEHYSSSTNNLSPEASSPVSLEKNVYGGDISEDLRQLLVEGRYSPVVEQQQAQADQCQYDTKISPDVDPEDFMEDSSASIRFGPDISAPVDLKNNMFGGDSSESRFSSLVAQQQVDLSLSNIQVSPLLEPAGASTMPAEFLLPNAAASLKSNLSSYPTTSGIEGREKRVDHEGIGRDPLLESSVRSALRMCETVRCAHDAAESSTNIEEDLHALGKTLYQHFSGQALPAEDVRDNTTKSDDGGERSTKIRGSTGVGNKNSGNLAPSAAIPFLKDMGFPVSLSILVASLLDATCDSAPDRYCSTSDVEEDLLRMVTNPDRYLFDPPLASGGTQLAFPKDKLYGREQQSEILMEGFDRVISTRTERHGLLMIAGKSGTGKSTLVDELRTPLAERSGMFVSCKFDLQGHEQPMSVIFRAFDEYCKSLVEGDQAILGDVAGALRQALGSNAAILKDLIPHLGPILGGWESTSSAIQQVDNATFNYILFCFRVFVRTIASPTHPVVVLFDDLQFADKSSIDLITMLVTDTESSSLLFVGCYRDNEVDTDHPLMDFLGAVTMAAVPMSTVSLSNLDKDRVNEFVSDTLHLSPRLTRALSDSLHTKTGGNPLFVLELLKSLCEERLLHYSARSRRWEWNADAIWEKDIPDFAVDLVLDRMRNYGPEIQLVLRVASCLGSRFDAEIMQIFYCDGRGGEFTVTSHLEKLVADGLLVLVDSTFKFTHDQILQAAYSLTPIAEREEMHLQVGRQLLARLVLPGELDRMLFTVVDQLNRGSSLLTDHDEKLRVAELNLMAGKKASSASLFLQASIYFVEGTVLVEDRDWESHYDFCLELFTSCAEAQAATGTPGVLITLTPVFRHARRLEDSFRANIVVLATLGNEDKPLDALKHGLQCAAQIGEVFPESIDLGMIMKEIGKTQAMIQKHSFSLILQKELMTDEVKLYAMTLLGRLTLFTYTIRPELVPMLGCRMIQISLTHGLCPQSASAFAVLGCVLCSSPQGVARAYELGKFALALVDRVKDRSTVYRVYIAVYSMVNVLKEPIQACIEKTKEAYKSSLSAGDFEVSRTCVRQFLCTGLQSGYQLDSFIAQGRTYTLQLRNHKQKFMDPVCTIYVQAALNLSGPCEDPTYLSGEMITGEEGSSKSLSDAQYRRGFVLRHLYLLRMWLAYLFGQYRLAADLMEEQQRARGDRAVGTPQIVVNESFYSSLIASAMAREERGGPWKEVAKEELEKVRSWSVNSSWNFQHKVELLTAEIAWLDGDSETARSCYDAAIESAERHQFINEQAVACERAGLFVRDTLSPEAAKAYFSRAHRCYVEWGAKMKAEDVMRRHLG